MNRTSFSHIVFQILFIGALLGCSSGSSLNIDAQIGLIGGQPVSEASEIAKSTVLVLTNLPDGVGVCTGSLISPRLILTAAHCVLEGEDYKQPLPPGTLVFVYFGTQFQFADLQRLANEGFKGDSRMRLVKKTVVHPEWAGGEQQREVSQNDFALLALNESAPPSTQPIQLLNQSTPLTAQATITTAGFGPTADEFEKRTLNLRTAEFAIESVSAVRQQIRVTNSATTSIKTGDSGGPAILKVERQSYLVGVASYGVFGKSADYGLVPNVFNWIQETSQSIDGVVSGLPRR